VLLWRHVEPRDMTSLDDVYDGEVRGVAGRQRRTLGRALVAIGAVALLAAVTIGTTKLAQSAGLSVIDARELAGVLGGLGLPALLVGSFVVLPTSRATRAGAALGASLAVFGVVLFVSVYPERWLSADPATAVATMLVYGAGALTTFWCLFISLATFNRRRDPGGTARMEVTEEGTLKVITDTTGRAVGRGAVGLFGTGPDGSVATQTAAAGSGGGVTSAAPTTGGEVLEPEPSADGAGAVAESAATDDEFATAVSTRGRPDEYCGNCGQFRYVRADGDLAPYCGFHDDVMDDMAACDQWAPNNEPASRY
jgi:membrane associated rhomboid family serine protease